MEEEGMVLNLHGEVPSDDAKNISILNAEKHFLEHLRKLAADFPKLRIVLEHATTAEAVECVSRRMLEREGVYS
jgi:dihydroorotase